jgi:hypothetical protein
MALPGRDWRVLTPRFYRYLDPGSPLIFQYTIDWG